VALVALPRQVREGPRRVGKATPEVVTTTPIPSLLGAAAVKVPPEQVGAALSLALVGLVLRGMAPPTRVEAAVRRLPSERLRVLGVPVVAALALIRQQLLALTAQKISVVVVAAEG
jgi:hypothetical protein